jgi:hypothetical protein
MEEASLNMMCLTFNEALTDSLMKRTNSCLNSDMKNSKTVRFNLEEKKLMID